MKIKIQTRKFIRNIIIGIIALMIVAFIINIAAGFKRDKYVNVTNLVIGEYNVTADLVNPIYKDENGELYLSKEDIKNFFDKTIYYDEKEHMIIATSEVAVGSMVIGKKQVVINGSTKDTLSAVTVKNNIIYIPVKEMQSIYNLEIKYIQDSNVLVIDRFNEGMVKAEAEKKTTIRYKQRTLSKKVGELQEGDVVSAFYTTSKGWRQIRTEDGTVGYVKANILTNEYILRQDMNQKPETKQISLNLANNTIATIDSKSIIVKDLLKMTQEGILIKNTDTNNINQSSEIWANLSIDNLDLSKFETRNKLIKNILSISMKNDIKGINIIATSENKNLDRFIIELAPQLREIGIKTNIVENEYFLNIDFETYKDIVDYIIK